MTAPAPIIRVRDLVVGFRDRNILKGLSLDIRAGEILGFVGASGQGKSVLTRTILGLNPKRPARSRYSAGTSTSSPTRSGAGWSSAGACCSSRAPCSRR